MTFLIICTSIIFIASILALILAITEKDATLATLSAAGFTTIGILLSDMMYYNEPRAIDVYKDKTTLQITYQDSIPVDSVVVFKEHGCIR